MSQTTISIIGCGGVARAHQRACDSLGISIVAVADPSQAALDGFAEGREDVSKFLDFRELIRSGVSKGCIICTPPCFHEEIAVFAMEHGMDVLCEKPLAHTVDSARRMAGAAQASNRLLMPAFRHRFLPAIGKMRELTPGIGPLVMFRNLFCGGLFDMPQKWFSKKSVSGGGCLIDTGTHSIDLFRFLVGEIAEQQALMHSNMKGLEVEDAASLTLKSVDGVVGSVQCSWAAGAGAASVELYGQKGKIVFDYSTPGEVRSFAIGASDWETHAVEAAGGFTEEVEHFAGAMEGKWPLRCTARDGVRAQEVVEAVYSV